MQGTKAGFERKPIEGHPTEWVDQCGTRRVIPNEGAEPSCMTNRIEVPLKVRRAILVPGNVAVLSADFSGAYIKPGKNAPRLPLSWRLHLQMWGQRHPRDFRPDEANGKRVRWRR